MMAYVDALWPGCWLWYYLCRGRDKYYNTGSTALDHTLVLVRTENADLCTPLVGAVWDSGLLPLRAEVAAHSYPLKTSLECGQLFGSFPFAASAGFQVAFTISFSCCV